MFITERQICLRSDECQVIKKPVVFDLKYQSGAIMVVVDGEHHFEGYPDGTARAVEK
jgi:hypothetical protein